MISDDASHLTRLRKATRSAHASMETVPILQRLVMPALSLEDYISVLQHMHAFHSCMEPAIALALDGHPAVCLLDGSRPRALLADLRWFGAQPLAFGMPGQATCPELNTHAAGLGALYVMEGSGLGGRVIARHVQASLSVAPGAGGSFYGGLSAEAARLRWVRYCAFLDLPAQAADAICEAAIASFATLENSLRTVVPTDLGRAFAGMVAS